MILRTIFLRVNLIRKIIIKYEVGKHPADESSVAATVARCRDGFIACVTESCPPFIMSAYHVSTFPTLLSVCNQTRIRMGTQSSKSISDLGDLQGMVLQQAANIKDLALLSHDDLLAHVNSLNQIMKTMQNRGQKLVFAIQHGTDNTVFWKATVRIACVKADITNKPEARRLLTLKQFIEVYNTLMMYQDSAKKRTTVHGADSNVASCSAAKSTETANTSKQFSDSACGAQMEAEIFKAIDSEWSSEKIDECCICMDRKPDIILPCTHSYCLVCIENWNVSHKTCPVCRDTVENTDDSWVISEAPNSEEMTSEMRKFLGSLVYKKEDAT